MRAFYFASPGVRVDNGSRKVGELSVDPGSYVVFAKADVAVNALPTTSQDGGGLFALKFAGHHDDAYVAIKQESGENIETASLMLAAETEGQGHVRLEFSNPYSLPVYVNSIRILALQVDELTSSGGEGAGAGAEQPDEEEQMSNLVRYGLADASATVSIAKLLHPDG
jgi:hypothetical protein